MSAKKKKIFIVLAGLISLSGVGCGQALTATYRGTETANINGANQTPNSVTISLTQKNNDEVAGTFQSSYSTGNIAGRPSGHISVALNLNASYPGPAAALLAGLPPLSATTPINCGTYVGKLAVGENGNTLSGRLELTQPAPVPSPYAISMTAITQVCPSLRTLQLTKE